MKSPHHKIDCAECDEPLEPHHPAVIYDGEWCHLDCAAEAEDEASFNLDFGAD